MKKLLVLLGLMFGVTMWAHGGLARMKSSWAVIGEVKDAYAANSWLEPENPETCDGGQAAAPVVRALLVGIGDYDLKKSYQLLGPKNDVQLLQAGFQKLGVSAVKILSGRVIADDFRKEWHSSYREGHCGDTLFVLLSGHDLQDSAAALVFSDFHFKNDRPLADKVLSHEALARGIHSMRVKGINIVLVADAPHSDSLLGIARTPNWEWTPNNNGTASPLSPASWGGFFGMYSSNSPDMELPIGVPNSKTFGLFSYSVGTIIKELAEVPFNQLVELLSERLLAVPRRYSEKPSPPVFESSVPYRPPLAVGLPGGKELKSVLRGTDTRQVEIIKPAVSRGATRVGSGTLTIEGRVVAPTMPVSIEANGTAGKMFANGTFRIEVPVNAGQSRVGVTAWWSETDFLPKSFTVVSQAGQTVLNEGKRYAVIFASQNYPAGSYAPLATPIADAKALREVLEKRYGFATSIRDESGQDTKLYVENATRKDILRTLAALRRSVGPDDSVVVFYAGHGHYDKVADRAYWLPVDAERDEESTWVSADDVNAQVQKLNAKHVLVIADSCYSGAFRQRSAEAAEVAPKDRLQFLDQVMVRPSRSFISSGASEPVSDGGGGGHSVFARALLDGLKMEAQAVTAGELFTRHLQQRVGGKSGQVPQYFPMKTGHQGGEFVFAPLTAVAN